MKADNLELSEPLQWLTLDDGAETWLRAFRRDPRRTYDLFRRPAAKAWKAIVFGYEPGNRMVELRAREFPFGRGAREAACAWLAGDGLEAGVQRARGVATR